MFERYHGSDEVFVIAEVGQNHQGDLSEALRYIETFSKLGADAIKFQMRAIDFLFTPSALGRSYESENAFGNTYGEHRRALELSPEDWISIRAKCDECGVRFMCTPFDELSLAALVKLGVGALKVASFDLGNLPFLSRVCDAKVPIVLSTGGGRLEHIEKTIEFLSDREADFCILHCVSEYPCSVDKLDLGKIALLKGKYPSIAIGLSDHFNGILSGPIGFTLGARVFEKHVTLNRANKGTDHSFALEPRGFENFVRDIKRVPRMYGAKDISELGQEYVFKKLGKSICANGPISKGEMFSLENMSGIIDVEPGIPVREAYRLIGRMAKVDYGDRELLAAFELD